MDVDLRNIADKNGIKFFLISFVDLFGNLRSKLVPSEAISDMQKNGAGFAGFATWLDMTPAHPDMFAVPDAKSLMILPWKREIAWLASDLWMDNKPIEASPRVALKKQLLQAEKLGLYMKTGVECEYHLINADGSAIFDDKDNQQKPCYDQQALMRQYPIISQICNAMIALNWRPYQNDHEDANGQFEMNWDFADALVTADRHVFFKFMVKSIAEINSARATFMPKPFSNLAGNGCHAHVSVWNAEANKNLFIATDDNRNLGLSHLAYQFLGGIMHNAECLTAIFNSTVNSYKRINAARTSSGATWAPDAITYSGNNRTHMIRVPAAGRFELRLMDGAVNPYLLQAGILAAGLDGIENKRNPGEPLNINMYELGKDIKGYKQLPHNLLDALRLFENSNVLRQKLGSQLVDAFVKLKNVEWNDYCNQLTKWELDNTLDC